MPLFGVSVIESAGSAVTALLAVLPVVPHGGAVGTWRQRGAGRLLPICLVLGVDPERACTQVNHYVEYYSSKTEIEEAMCKQQQHTFICIQ